MPAATLKRPWLRLALIPTLTAAAVRYMAKGPAASEVLSFRVAALAEEVFRAMFMRKLKIGISFWLRWSACSWSPATWLLVRTHRPARKPRLPAPGMYQKPRRGANRNSAGTSPLPGFRIR